MTEQEKRVADAIESIQAWKARAEKLEAELAEARTAPPKTWTGKEKQPCGHNTYWKTHFERCMACRAEKAEAELAEAQQKWPIKWLYVPDAVQCNHYGVGKSCRACLMAFVESAESTAQALRDKLAMALSELHHHHGCDERCERDLHISPTPEPPATGQATGDPATEPKP